MLPGALLFWSGLLLAQQPATPPAHLGCAGIEQFMRQARLGTLKSIGKGSTLPRRATLELENFSHDVAIQTVDISKDSFETDHGAELNFRDSWKYNVAGYELAKILELDMVPPYVERSLGGQAGSFSWWVNNAIMESDRVRKKIEPPDPSAWNNQMYSVRVFHELIYDTDPNLTNVLITPDWQIWVIDFTRAFRTMPTLRNANNLAHCERKLLQNLRGLSKEALKPKLERWLTPREIDAVAARAARIVSLLDQQIAARGEGPVLYDSPRIGKACGTGL
jgi:hypothetical protein